MRVALLWGNPNCPISAPSSLVIILRLIILLLIMVLPGNGTVRKRPTAGRLEHGLVTIVVWTVLPVTDSVATDSTSLFHTQCAVGRSGTGLGELCYP